MTIFTPDVVGMKMASAYAEVLGCPLGFVAKRRTGASTVEATNLVGEVDGREVLIVDDMTETAGTLTAAAKLLPEYGVLQAWPWTSRLATHKAGRGTSPSLTAGNEREHRSRSRSPLSLSAAQCAQRSALGRLSMTQDTITLTTKFAGE